MQRKDKDKLFVMKNQGSDKKSINSDVEIEDSQTTFKLKKFANKKLELMEDQHVKIEDEENPYT